MQIYFYYALHTTNSSILGTTNMLIQRINHIVAPGVHPPLLQNAGSTSGGWRSFRSSWQNSNRSKPLDVQWSQAIGNRRPKWILNIWQICVDSCWFIQSLMGFLLKNLPCYWNIFCHNFSPPKKKISKKGDSILVVKSATPPKPCQICMGSGPHQRRRVRLLAPPPGEVWFSQPAGCGPLGTPETRTHRRPTPGDFLGRPAI